ncbi:histone H2B type 3-B-like [Bufo bufo]|uniref:histone H2B type 3-B-like n=1 Tax=Bufo bufo TaxID=8384 RepID=UPI001ABEC9A1|nr:histone H2B type 3-B-like [Bufo bufo]
MVCRERPPVIGLLEAHDSPLYNTQHGALVGSSTVRLVIRLLEQSRMKCSSNAVNKMEAGSQRSAGKKSRTKSKNYSRFIYKVLKQGPQGRDICLAKESELLVSIASEAARLSIYNRRTITRREVESAVKNIVSLGPSTCHLPGSAATN